MVKAAEVTGDWVCLLESKAHGIHWVAPAADHPLQREMKGRRRYIQMPLTDVTPQHRCYEPTVALGAEHWPVQAESSVVILIPTDKKKRQRTSLSFSGRRALWMSHYVWRGGERVEGPSGSWMSDRTKFKHSQETFKAQVTSFACTQQWGGKGKTISPVLLILPCKGERIWRKSTGAHWSDTDSHQKAKGRKIWRSAVVLSSRNEQQSPSSSSDWERLTHRLVRRKGLQTDVRGTSRVVVSSRAALLLQHDENSSTERWFVSVF